MAVIDNTFILYTEANVFLALVFALSHYSLQVKYFYRKEWFSLLLIIFRSQEVRTDCQQS